MQRFVVLFTGGTIASAFGEGGSKGPDSTVVGALREHLSGFFAGRDVDVICREPWGVPGLDSSDLDPGHWVELASSIARELENGATGFLILHGTDTMAYTSAWLSLCFPHVDVPIVLTGSQLTLDYMPEDVTVNLRGAAQVACSDISGVWIYCNWKLIPGNRAHKAQALHPDAYVATNGQPMYFNPEWARKDRKGTVRQPLSHTLSPLAEKAMGHGPEEARNISSRMAWLFCTPGFSPRLSGEERVLAILGYGAGNAPSGALHAVESAFDGLPKPHVIACSQAEGDMKNPGSYAGVGIASLAGRGFTVWSQMDYPVEFIHALGCYSLLASSSAPGFVLSHYLRECSSETPLL
ncbi:asparaginase [Dethiosulfovibrio sp. F2B]|uniref:asparaginase n=1 Tax=Dethiosulfovibrio faecalis TaxID=2720018 RepID=UPI001F26DAB4|nr:asparaginase [Dethiosulfovibrio faecalis]MCF4151616.1 asparaginase [Dethiosulfovibrio faecalis]